MTKAQAQWLSDYVFLVASKMKLKDWDFDIDESPPDTDNAAAAIRCVPGRKYAVIRVAVDFFQEKPQQQRHSITHELIHCHMSMAHNYIDGLLDSGDLTCTHREAFMFNLEYGVDGMADAIAPFMPLPPKPVKG